MRHSRWVTSFGRYSVVIPRLFLVTSGRIECSTKLVVEPWKNFACTGFFSDGNRGLTCRDCGACILYVCDRVIPQATLYIIRVSGKLVAGHRRRGYSACFWSVAS